MIAMMTMITMGIRIVRVIVIKLLVMRYIYIYTHMNDIHDNHGKYDNHGTKNHNSSVLKVDDFNNDKTMMVLTIYLNM